MQHVFQNGSDTLDACPTWAPKSSPWLHSAPTSTTASPRQQHFTNPYFAAAGGMPMYTQPDLNNTGYALWPTQPPVYDTNLALFPGGPTNVSLLSYGNGFAQPLIYNSGFNSGLGYCSGPSLSANMNERYLGQGPVFDNLGFNSTQSDNGAMPSFHSAVQPYFVEQQSAEPQAIPPFLAGTEAPTMNPAMVLQNRASNSSDGMSSVLFASPGSVQSEATLLGVSNTLDTPPSQLILTPRASSRESTARLSATDLGDDKERKTSRSTSLEVRSPECMRTEQVASEMMDGAETFNRKRKYEKVRGFRPISSES